MTTPDELPQINPYVALSVQEYLQETISESQILKHVIMELTKAPKTYYLRINLTKISQKRLIHEMSINFPDATISKGPLSNSLGISISGPNKLYANPIHVYCDKFAAEAVSLGADLYIPGVTEMGKFQKGEDVSVLLQPKKVPEGIKYDEDHFQVAVGTTCINSRDFPGMTHGLCVKTFLSTYMVPKYRQSLFYSSGLISDHHLQANIATKIFIDLVVKQYFSSISDNFEDPEKSQNPDPIIYDVCSAPGHKTCALSEWGHFLTAQRSKPHWFPIISIDRSKNRLEHLRSDIQRLGLEKIEVIPSKLEKIAQNYPQLINKGDFVFFDPPCSALGIRPKLFIQKSRKELEDYAVNQRRLLKIVDTLVKPRGYLMYNTCTIPIQENEGIIAYAITKLGYNLVPLSEEYYSFGQSGVPMDGIPQSNEKYMRRFLPNYPVGSDGQGYFIALLKKS
ncbi:MAG: PUA domain-containing protein [Promethearchaeota archaeon]